MAGRKNIVRVDKNKNYTVINNTSLYDERLSWKAKAIHAFMLSRPDDWTFYNEEMTQWAKDGFDSLASGLKELKQYGYVKKEQRRGKDGKFEWVTVVYEVPPQDVQQPSTEQPLVDVPCLEKPATENPQVETPFVENPELLNTNTRSTDSLNTDTPNIQITNHPQNAEQQKPTQLADKGWGVVVDFYHQNIHPLPAPIVYEKLGQLYDLYPIPELVREALQIAVLNQAKNPIRYAEQILIRWRNQHITTLAQARFEQQKEGQSYAGNQRSAQPSSSDEYGGLSL